jgi:hypothetical protein
MKSSKKEVIAPVMDLDYFMYENFDVTQDLMMPFGAIATAAMYRDVQQLKESSHVHDTPEYFKLLQDGVAAAKASTDTFCKSMLGYALEQQEFRDYPRDRTEYILQRINKLGYERPEDNASFESLASDLGNTNWSNEASITAMSRNGLVLEADLPNIFGLHTPAFDLPEHNVYSDPAILKSAADYRNAQRDSYKGIRQLEVFNQDSKLQSLTAMAFSPSVQSGFEALAPPAYEEGNNQFQNTQYQEEAAFNSGEREVIADPNGGGGESKSQ